MSRKNMFKGLEPQDDEPAREAPVSAPMRNTSMGALGALNMDLAGRSSRMVQEINPEAIESSGHRDRLEIEATDIKALAKSISDYGQQVPVLVRPLPGSPGRYQIVYGRRRLAAVRRLGTPIKALVRTLSDEEAVLAQGQENSQRTDPSFIEKAIFAADLRESEYSYGVILDALATDKASLSRMEAVTSAVPMDWIYAIGPAPDVGRRRWMLVAQTISGKVDLPPPSEIVFPQDQSSNQRFDTFESMVKSLKAVLTPEQTPIGAADEQVDRGQPAARKVAMPDGRQIGEVRSSATSVVLKVMSKKHPEFGSWIEARAEDILRQLFDQWTEDKSRAEDVAQDSRN